jgi:O-antigen ligase
MMVLILYFVFCFYTIKKKFFLLFILITINYFIYASQTRGSFIGVLLLYLIYIFFFKEEKKKKLLIVVATFILPIILYETTLIAKKYLYKNTTIVIEQGKGNRILYPPSINLKREINSYKNTDIEDLSTGRSIIWSRAFKIINENKNFIGYGPQADRILLNKDKLKINPQERHFWDNNVSNGMLYSFLCGGIIGLILFMLIYLLIFYEIYKSIFIKKIYHKNNNYIVNFSIVTLLFLSIRSFFENSYAVFGIDSFFICITYSILYRFNNYKN